MNVFLLKRKSLCDIRIITMLKALSSEMDLKGCVAALVLSKKFRIHIHTTPWLSVTSYPTELNLLMHNHMQMGEQE